MKILADGQIVFEITADGKKAIASVQDVTRAIESESKKWDSAAGSAATSMESKLTSMLTKVGTAFSAAKLGQALFDFGKEAIDAASDLREVQNVVDVTFGEGAAQIESWAKTAQTQFGLTETQAKQFTSTLGAMMKSSGLAGDEIIGMSTDLAGLAADMASFYNLDFETAFQKIRAGISGETEPLKQLGINMSVANLEAYALTQGITKSFDKMSQGEQTMLRYQYMMQATADAQGDFARTADGYANAQRRVETAISSIKTSVGTMLLDVVEPLTTGLAGFLEKLQSVPEKTVLDEFADIDATTEQKMAQVTKAADDARALVGVLKEIQAEKVENASLTTFVSGLTTQLGDLDAAMQAASTGDYQGTIKGIADAMALKTGSDATAWNTLLTAISTKLPSAAEAVDADGQTYTDFLSAAAEAAAELGGEYPALWQSMLDTLGSETTENALAYMAKGQAAADAMESIGISAAGLDGSESDKWAGLLGVLATAEPTEGMFGNDAQTAASNISSLATALTSNDPATKQEAWASMLATLTDNIDGVAVLAKQSPDDTKAWLNGLATEAAKLDPSDPAAWDSMFTALLDGLPGLADTDVGKEFLADLGSLATKSNSLKADSAGNWTALLTALNEAPTTGGIFGKDAAKRIESMANALANGKPDEKIGAWRDMLGVLSENADSVAKLTGQSVNDVQAWFKALEEATPETGENLNEWNALLTSLVDGFTALDGEGLGEGFTESLEKLDEIAGGNGFFTTLATEFMQLGDESDTASRALKALGVDTTGVEDKQALWLKTCKELVQTIPGLSSIIDTNTGYVKGGVDAINTYIDEWEAANKKMIAMQALSAKEEALAKKRVELMDYWLEAEKAQKKAEAQLENVYAVKPKGTGYNKEYDEASKLYEKLLDEASLAADAYKTQEDALKQAEEEMKLYRQVVEDMPGDVDKFTASTEAATVAQEQFAVAASDAKDQVKSAKSALEEIEKYYDNIYKGIEKTVEGTHDLFGAIETPADKARAQIAEYQKELDKLVKEGKDTTSIEVKISGANEAIKTVESMISGLKQQSSWYEEYNAMLEKARQLGYSEDVLSAVADGSAESYDYLVAMTDATIQKLDPRIEQLNEAYRKSGEERDKLVTELADQTLKTDEAFQSLVQSATDAIEGLNLGDEAKTALMATVQGIANGISAKIPIVRAQVESLNKILGQLGNTTAGGSSGFVFKAGGNGNVYVEGLSKGMDYVPFDNYLAALHEGESVLTAEEAKVWRAFRASGMGARNSLDYDALGATMRENVHAGGNVYLDGQTVGRVISGIQGNAYRALERSGFQQ